MATKEYKKVIVWFVYAFAVIWGSSLPGISLPGISLFPLRIIIILWTLWALMRKKKIEKVLVFKIEPTTTALFIFIIWSIITSFWVCNYKAYITAFIVYLTAICTLIICKVECEKNENYFYYAGIAIYWNVIIMCIISIYESFTGKYLYESYDYYLTTFNAFGLFRPKAAFYNTNNLTVFLLTCLPISLFAVKKFLPKILIIVLSTIVIFLTESRTGIVGLIMFLALYLLYSAYSLKGSKLIITILIVVIALCLFINYSDVIFQSITNGNNVDDEDRLPIWKSMIQLCQNYFFMGAGPGQSAHIKGSLGLPHNYFLEILLEFGIIGLISFLCIVRFSFIPKNYILKDNKSIYLRCYMWLFILCTICPSSMQGYYYLWYIFGICIAYNNKQRNTVEVN